MKLTALQGVVRRRVLLNFRVDPEVIQRQLPEPFRAKLVGGWAIAGICLIRLEQLRPSGLPQALGLSSENAAHRVAVTWADPNGQEREGVYVLRRDTSSPLNALVGGRFFPGEHDRARFSVQEDAHTLELVMRTLDGLADVRLKAHPSQDLPSSSAFGSLAGASRFFEAGAIGYSPSCGGTRLDGLELYTRAWHIEPLAVELVEASYYRAESRFPAGSLAFDSALVMRDIPHEWRPVSGPTAPVCPTRRPR